MVLLSVLSALIIGSIFGAMDPAILSGSNPGLATYFAMFIGQSFLIIPVLYYLKSKKFNLIDSLRLNFVSSKIIYATVFISIGAMILSDESNLISEVSFLNFDKYSLTFSKVSINKNLGLGLTL